MRFFEMRKNLLLLINLFIATALVGCATSSTRTPGPEVGEGPLPPPNPQETKPIESEFGEIPIEVNQNVLKWIDYFQGKGRPYMEVYLSRSTRYMPLMKQLLKEQGMPEDLIYIALIESGFNSKANSNAAAVGYWQFIRATGKTYGLVIDKYVDERRDPVLSTVAAANYFKSLYSIFGDWYLAMSAYNAGENGVQRAVARHQTRNFWELAKKRKLPRETVNYVPKFMAAAIIAKDPKRFGFDNVDYQDPIAFELVKVDKALSLQKLADNMKVPLEDLKALNPAFRSDYVPPYKPDNTMLRVPVGSKDLAVAAMVNAEGTPPKNIADGFFIHRVRRGENLGLIARRYGTSVAALKRENGVRARSLLRIGQRLKIPETARSYASFVAEDTAELKSPPAAAAAEDSVKAEVPEFHKVRRGENLSTIARKYGLTVDSLRTLNGLGQGSMLRAGQKLKVRQADSGAPKEDNKQPPDGQDGAEKPGQGSVSRGRFYQVKAGENLAQIASRFNLKLSELFRLNNLSRKSVIHPGQKILVSRRDLASSKKFHVVRRGETLTHIAQKYKVSMSDLVRRNNLSSRSRVLAGTKLVIQ